MANTSTPEIRKAATPAEVCKNLADYIVTEMGRKAGPFHIALSGGSTPKLLFRLMAEEYQDKIDWSRLHCYWGDDRMVPYDSPESNYGMTKELLFDHVPIPAENVHPVPTQLEAEVAASAYTEAILQQLPKNEDGLPSFDINLLGMGGDGHTASIFPDQMELLSDKRICAVATHPETGQQRVTLTGPVINASERIVFLVTGAGKAARLSQVLAGGEVGAPYPATHIQPPHGQLLWFVDEAAMTN